MPQASWSAKRERQYEHIKEGLTERGDSVSEAEEIAARTVNKERARAGESRESSRTSTEDISSGRRGGLRSHRGAGGRTRDQLYEEARRKGIEGRSKMSKAQLERAVGSLSWRARRWALGPRRTCPPSAASVAGTRWRGAGGGGVRGHAPGTQAAPGARIAPWLRRASGNIHHCDDPPLQTFEPAVQSDDPVRCHCHVTALQQLQCMIWARTS